MKINELNRAWSHIWDRAQDVNDAETNKSIHWESLALGFALAHGLSIPDAAAWAIDWNTHYKDVS